MSSTDKETEFLYARLSDLYSRMQKGIFCVSPFFSPAELVFARRWISRAGARDNAVIFGGYGEAERARVYFLPDFMLYEAELDISNILSDYGCSDPTVILSVCGSGYRELSHRDFMGALLSLGIKRDVIGDIVCVSPYEAYIFCDAGIVPYIKESLCKVANDSVTLKEAELKDINLGVRNFTEIHDTVASLRFDSVISAACNLSREVSKKLILSGVCELNYESVISPDRELCEGDIFSIRGKGKFVLSSCGGLNRRTRLRITVLKYR